MEREHTLASLSKEYLTEVKQVLSLGLTACRSLRVKSSILPLLAAHCSKLSSGLVSLFKNLSCRIFWLTLSLIWSSKCCSLYFTSNIPWLFYSQKVFSINSCRMAVSPGFEMIGASSLAEWPAAKAKVAKPPAEVPIMQSNISEMLKSGIWILSAISYSISANIFMLMSPLTPPPSKASTLYFLSNL